jgi:hypothetical protein
VEVYHEKMLINNMGRNNSADSGLMDDTEINKT